MTLSSLVVAQQLLGDLDGVFSSFIRIDRKIWSRGRHDFRKFPPLARILARRAIGANRGRAKRPASRFHVLGFKADCT